MKSLMSQEIIFVHLKRTSVRQPFLSGLFIDHRASCRKSDDLLSTGRKLLSGFAYDLFSVYDFYWNLFFVLFSGSGTFLFHYTPDPALHIPHMIFTHFSDFVLLVVLLIPLIFFSVYSLLQQSALSYSDASVGFPYVHMSCPCYSAEFLNRMKFQHKPKSIKKNVPRHVVPLISQEIPSEFPMKFKKQATVFEKLSPVSICPE